MKSPKTTKDLKAILSFKKKYNGEKRKKRKNYRNSMKIHQNNPENLHKILK